MAAARGSMNVGGECGQRSAERRIMGIINK